MFNFDEKNCIFSYTEKMITEIVSKHDKATLEAIERYCKENNIVPNIIEKENQELKSQLAGTTHCFDEEEHRKLKDEIKKLERIIELCHLDAKETLAEQELQKKEFINYLQKEINQYTAHIDAINSYGISIYSPDYDNSKLKLAIYKEILQKYKSITGVSDEKK